MHPRAASPFNQAGTRQGQGAAKRWRTALILLLLLILCSGCVVRPRPVASGNELQVHFIDVGQGDAILLLQPSEQVSATKAPVHRIGQIIRQWFRLATTTSTADRWACAALIDGGERTAGADLARYLGGAGVERLDLIIATHPHSDHIGGLIEVLGRLPVDRVVTNGAMHTTSTYEQFLDAIAAAEAEYLEAKRGDTLGCGGLRLEVLHPQQLTGHHNNDSLVIRLAHGSVAFLFMGDAEQPTEAGLLHANLKLFAQILKIGHHASRSSSSPPFLAAIRPEVAVYFAGQGNSYGHPHAETLAALAAVGATVYGTDVNGTIVIFSDGQQYHVETSRQGEPRPPSPATPTVTPRPLMIDIVSLTTPITPGGNASLRIRTTPGAACTIAVHYRTGPSQAEGLGPQQADDQGIVTWRWRVGADTTPGVWRIVVTATIGNQTVEHEIPFEVKR